jgi:hypothetical protein
MGFAAHLGPWRLGTNKDTTGTTAATTQNMGCTVVAQSNDTTFADTSATNMFAIPAGSQILNVYLDVTEAFNAGTNNSITIKAGATTIASVTATSANIATGRQTLTLAAPATWVNVGTSDLFITSTYAGTGTAATTGIGYVTVEYVVRGSDGAQAPTAQQV